MQAAENRRILERHLGNGVGQAMPSAQDQIGLIMQLRRRGIRDTRVLRAIERVPRELFVDEAFADHAYQDIALPIDCGQTISQPFVVAFMTENLELDERHKVPVPEAIRERIASFEDARTA